MSPPATPSRSRSRTPGLIGWALYDFANSSYSAIIQTFIFAAYFGLGVVGDSDRGQALWSYAISAAGFVIALAGPVLGAAADQGGRRKPWILAFSAACISCTALMWFVRPDASYVPLAIGLALVSTVCSEAAVIFYNAMLPSLAPREKIGRWSGWGWACGYGATVLSMLVALLLFIRPDPPLFRLDRAEQEHVRATFPFVAVWFALFMIPFAVLTPDTAGTGKPLLRAVRDGLAQLLATLRHLRRYGTVARFLLAKMLYIDGLTTIFSLGGIYAAAQFGFTAEQLILFGIGLNLTGAIGAAALSLLDERLGGRNLIVVSLLGLITTGAALLLAQTTATFWVFAMLLGIFVGPVQAASRAYLARAAPPEMVNEFFGLYAFSGKATAFLGPLLAGLVTTATGSGRLGMSVVVVFLVAGLLVLLTVPNRPGR